MIFLGSRSAKLVVYLDNKPQHCDALSGHRVDVCQLIADNGNHWRKIMTILTKISSGFFDKADWRNYRDTDLLKTREQLCFSHAICELAKIHIFSGKSCWQRFKIDEQRLKQMRSTQDGRVFYSVDKTLGLLLYTPYFDYRQFPNVLIAQVIEIINDFDQQH